MLRHILLEGNALNDLTSKIIGYVPLCLVGAVIFCLSSMSNHNELASIKSVISDHTWHALVFFSFSICAAFGAFHRTGKLIPNSVVEASVITILFAFLDEFHQSFVPYREASMMDIWADIFGGFVGIGLFVLAVRYKKTPETEGDSGV